MFRLLKENIVIETESEIKKDELIANGYELVLDKAEETDKSTESGNEVDLTKLKKMELEKLAKEIGFSDDEIKKMTKDELIEKLQKGDINEN